MTNLTNEMSELIDLHKKRVIFHTLDGKNRAFLKSFRMTDVMNVPKKRITDIRKTFGIGSG